METRSLKIELGKATDYKDSLSEMLENHWDEVAKNKHLMVLKPDWERYKILEDQGRLLTLFAFVEDNVVGYSCNIIMPHLHYSDLICSYNDVLFIAKEYRASSLGLKLIRETEIESSKIGAKLMLWHAKQDSSLDKILPRRGCKVQEIIYSKEL